MRRPTLLGFSVLSLLVIPQASAQDAPAPDSARPAFAATFRLPPLPVPSHPALAPGGRLGPRRPAALVAADWERRVRAARDGRALVWTPGALPDTAAVADAAPTAPARTVQPASLFGLGPYADIGMLLTVRFELKADRLHNLRCTSVERQLALSGCNPGFPTITPNPQYSVRTSGLVGQRLHVNVDFDSQREFDANNNLQVWYEGLEDEMLRRVEAGNVTFQMPPSRFISAAVPANNFGVQAVGQVGPMEFRGIYAQQKGNVIKDRLYTVGETTTQPVDREARDLDFEPGRFFFTVDPAALPGYPAVDILGIASLTLPESLRVGDLQVYRVRANASAGPTNLNVGGVRATACGATVAQPVDCSAATGQRAGPYQWEILKRDIDYYVDPSGAWVALANRLAQDDYLAVSYITADGLDSVGTLPVESSLDTTRIDTLRLVYAPNPGLTAAAPSFRFEIRSAYRVGGSEIARQTAELTLTVNQRERTVATGQTYLEFLGLALANDPSSFDEYNRLFPRARDPQQGHPVRDYFVVFPHLQPFADARLDQTERNDSLYRTPRTQLQAYGPPSVFTLRLHASVSASADRATLSLNSFQIREGSERLYLRNALLTRGVDYTIDYATGQVQFTAPDSLFQGGAAQIRAQFEERAAFAIAPTSIYGLAARYDLGTRGHVNFTGLFQQEQSAFNRPPLGFEPSSSFIGGVSTELRFQPEWLTRAVDALPGVHTDVQSFLNVSAELAVSRPTPNRLGQAYLEEFESEAGRFLSLAENAWRWGSLPSSPRGAEPFGILSTGFDILNASALTWQSLPINPGGAQVVFFPQQIDPTIRISGQAQSAEPVLWLMLKPDTVLGLAHNRPFTAIDGLPNWVRPVQNAPRWRSITQPLSATGIDLSRVEFLEFWVWEDAQRVARANRTALIIDVGAVFEDAVAFVPTAFRAAGGDTTYYGARLTGPGRLDSERDPITHTWNAHEDDVGFLTDFVADGILDSTTGLVVDSLPLCSATVNGQVVGYGFGDLRSRCGRNNGAVDSEDQDGDFALDQATGVRTQEDFVRFVFPIGDERYFVRDGGSIQGATWRLYRIPFRSDSLQIGLPNLRQVQAIRLTVVAPQMGPASEPDSQVYFALSRVRFVGSSWLKRAETPVRGIAGERGTGLGEVAASVVSTENRDLGYSPPPGVFDQADRRDAGLQLGSTQINERSLRVLGRGLQTGERAEAFLRFTSEGDKNFLRYKKLRVWARGRGPGWEDGDLEFFFKVGKDPDNFYFYHTPARTSSWEPEVVIDFGRWLVLRAQIEQAYLRGDTAAIGPGCPDSTLVPFDSAFVRCDGPYIVHVRHPGTAPPNLARVQEMAAGILRVNDRVFVDQAEVWVDDIRLSDVVQDAGLASAVDVALSAGGVADLAFALSRRDGNFRQLGEDPSYSTDNSAAVGGTVRLERFLPDAWGIAAPLSVRYATTSSEPFYLNRTDLRADVLQGLRTPLSSATSYGFSLRRTRRSPAALLRWLVDPVALSGTYATGSSRADFTRATSSSYAVNADYTMVPAPRIVRVAGLPLRVNPSGIRFRSGLTGADASRRNFQVPVDRPSDTLVVAAVSRGQQWRNSASVDLLPLTGLQLRADLASQRDLRDYGDSTTMGRLIRGARRTLLGLDVGVETQRTLTTLAGFTPQTRGWLRPRVSVSSSFSLSRDPNARNAAREIGDTAGAFALPTAFTNAWRFDAGANLDPRALGRALFGDSAGVTAILQRLTNVDLSLGRTRTSTFNRTALDPGLGYQLGWGGFDGFRSQGGVLAAAAAENTTLQSGGTLRLPLGLRVTSAYRRASGVTWVRRSDQQVPIRTRSIEWPSGGVNWSWVPSRGGLLGRLVTTLTVQMNYRRSEAGTVQAPLGGTGDASVAQTTTRSFAPSVTVTWGGGVLTAFDAASDRTNQLTAGNLFRSVRGSQNATLSFSFKPPPSIARLKTNIRTTARYSTSDNTTCLQQAGQPLCKAYVDSRQTQAQLMMDTDFPPNMSAGLQMAYVINEERQASRKIAQLVITAFVNLTTTVGQLR